jgi:hypothetical protein
MTRYNKLHSKDYREKGSAVKIDYLAFSLSLYQNPLGVLFHGANLLKVGRRRRQEIREEFSFLPELDELSSMESYRRCGSGHKKHLICSGIWILSADIGHSYFR